jgi:ribose-phosphate pyrophosphokinase
MSKRRVKDCEVDKTSLGDCDVPEDEMKGRTVVLVDDIADSCGTLRKAAESLQKDFGVARVICVLTHGIFAGKAKENLDQCDVLTDIFVTDSLPGAEGFHPKVHVVSVAPLLGLAVKNLIENKSLSDVLFP